MVISKDEIISILVTFGIDKFTALEIAKKIHRTEMSKKHIIKKTKGKWKNSDIYSDFRKSI